MDNVDAGTLAGAGSFHCAECGFAIALHELDQVPACPHCGGREFARSSIFGDQAPSDPIGSHDRQTPDWLAEVRDSLDGGDFLAYDDDGVEIVSLDDGWTRIGRSLAAHV